MKNRRTRSALAFAITGMIAGGSSLLAGGERNKPVKPKDVTLVGKIVDLQSFMTGKFMAADPIRSTQDCIRQGVPAALETEDGLIVIGMGERGPSRILLPLAFKKVEVKGKLYEKDGLRYLDMTTAALVKEKNEAEEGDAEHEGDGEHEGDEEHGGEEGSDEEP